MRRLESEEDLRRSVVTYELDDGRRVRFDEKFVREHGIQEAMKAAGIEPDQRRLPVFQDGHMVGTLPALFDPSTAKSRSFMYDFRRGDFTRSGDRWLVNSALGNGDLEAVPGFVPA
jgi:hypothetical protein